MDSSAETNLALMLKQILATMLVQGAVQSAMIDALIERGTLPPRGRTAVFARALADLRKGRAVCGKADRAAFDLAIGQMEALARAAPHA